MADLKDVSSIIAFIEQFKPVIELLKGLFSHKSKTPVPIVVPLVTVAGDDDIKAPPGVKLVRKVATVGIKLQQAQYNRERVNKQGSADFENAYTDKNPQGLYSNSYLAEINDGKSSLMWGSKFWIDMTARDLAGQEFLYADNLAFGNAFNTEIHVSSVDPYSDQHAPDTSIIGVGADGEVPKPGYITTDQAPIGQGISAWLASLGFRQQFKAFDKTGPLYIWGVVNGVKSSVLRIEGVK